MFGYRFGLDGLCGSVVESVVVLVENLAGFFMLMDLSEIVTVTHLATDAFIVVDKDAVGL